MVTPTISFVAGLLAVLYASLAYRGSAFLEAAPSFLRRQRDVPWLVGWIVIGVALMMGLVGLLLKYDLFLARVLLAGAGFTVLPARDHRAGSGATADRSSSEPGKDAFTGRWVKAAVVGGVLLVALTEALSLLHGLTTSSVALIWLTGAVIGTVYLWRRRASVTVVNCPRDAIDRMLVANVVLLVLVLALVALFVPPNTWDSMAYHVARIAHWAQQGSIAHYETTIPRQLYQPPGASFVTLHLYLLARGDRWLNLVQWFSMIGSLFGVAALAGLFGAGPRARVLAMVAAATIPIGLLESTTTQNDYVEALWLVCLAVLVVARQGPVIVGLALGRAVLAKGTGYLFAAPMIAWWCAEAMVRKRWRAVGAIALLVVTAGAVNAGHYARNLAWFGTPLGLGRDGPFVYTNDRHGALPILSVAVRNLAMQASTPWPRVNAGVTSAVERLHTWAGLDVNDPATTWYQTRFAVGVFRATEDLATNGAHLVLIGILFVVVLIRPRRRVATYVAALVVGFVAFSAALRWQPWHTRLELPLFVLAAPVVGLVLERRRLIGPLVAAGLLAIAWCTVFVNESRPPIGERNVVRSERTAQFFAARRDLEGAYRAVAARIEALKCRRVAVWSARDAAEYPLWVLTGAPWNDILIEHFNPEHPAATACALFISPLYDAPTSFPVAGVPYRRDVWVSPVALYLREPF